MNKKNAAFSIVVLTVFLAGCIPSQDATFEDVKKWVKPGLEAAPISPAEIQQGAQLLSKPLLEKPLTLDTAIQIALLNNKTLQAKYEDLWIAKASYTQAGTFSNPVFSGSVSFPSQGGSAKTELSIEQHFLDFFLVPLKGSANDLQFENTKIEVAQSVLTLAFEVKSAYFERVAAQQSLAMWQLVFNASEAAFELTRRQYKAGNISELQLRNEEAMFYQVKLDLAESKSRVNTSTEKLCRLLGVRKTLIRWNDAEKLPEIPPQEPGQNELEALALTQRLDLIMLKQTLEIQTKELAAVGWSGVSESKLGVKMESDSDGKSIGPTVEIPVPIFQSSQPIVAKQDALIRQSRYQIEAKESDIVSDVALAYEHLASSRQKVQSIRKDILPLRTKLIGLTQQHYNYMLMDVFALLQAKQNEIQAQQNYIEAMKEYWIARAELEKATGSK